jgi:hypothetical protein
MGHLPHLCKGVHRRNRYGSLCSFVRPVAVQRITSVCAVVALPLNALASEPQSLHPADQQQLARENEGIYRTEFGHPESVDKVTAE